MRILNKHKHKFGGASRFSRLTSPIKDKTGQGFVGIIALIIAGAILVGPLTAWYLSLNKTVGDIDDRLEAVTIATSEWERLSHMSLDELKAKKSELATPYSVGDKYQVQVNLGDEGYFANGTCSASVPSGKYANCFGNTTLVVYKDGDKKYTTRTLPLMAGNYTKEEIDDLLKNYVKNNSASVAEIALGYDTTDSKLKAFVNGAEISLGGLGHITYIDLQSSNYGGYIAPTQGFVLASGSSKNASLEVYVNGVVRGYVVNRDYGSGPITTTVPVNKGDTIQISGSCSWATFASVD